MHSIIRKIKSDSDICINNNYQLDVIKSSHNHDNIDKKL